MIVDINGKSLSNNFDLFVYYEQISGNDLMLDMATRSKKLTFLNGKIAEADEEIIKKFKVSEFTFNLYYAARCAFVSALIPLQEIKNEVTFDVMLSDTFQKKLFSLLETKKKE